MNMFFFMCPQTAIQMLNMSSILSDQPNKKATCNLAPVSVAHSTEPTASTSGITELLVSQVTKK